MGPLQEISLEAAAESKANCCMDRALTTMLAAMAIAVMMRPGMAGLQTSAASGTGLRAATRCLVTRRAMVPVQKLPRQRPALACLATAPAIQRCFCWPMNRLRMHKCT